MDFKKLLRKDDKAVSPVIGVILMVAITVILAAAIGSSVFSKGTIQSAPQANINVKPSSTGVIIEHLGGDTFVIANTDLKMFDEEGGAVEYTTTDFTTASGKFAAGDVIPITVNDTIANGDSINVKISDKETNQLICDKNVRFVTGIPPKTS
ncbi:type IV pilin N-terminal domain-containing protein [Methanosarcina sp. UBA411]|jgi:flagellin-like protein|uniref:type IV pilin N-terminal domain-containing protein n=1 Tax=Methanosarcina sp. UBA411 TaxID=1915589 RepID=UPI0025D54640|nr:type IV pilin N-terminal domain-containing protein [Methanosarcina sp. UBA411]